MWEILGLFLQAAAGHVLYLALHLESGSFPRPLSPAREREAFAALRAGGAQVAGARDLLIRHNLRLVAHVTKKYYAACGGQDDLISIGTIGLIKAVDTFDPARASKFSSYASRCIENAILPQRSLGIPDPGKESGRVKVGRILLPAACESLTDALQ